MEDTECDVHFIRYEINICRIPKLDDKHRGLASTYFDVWSKKTEKIEKIEYGV